MATSPGKSVTALFKKPSEAKAAYNLFKHPQATPDNLQSGHRRLVRQALREPGTCLLIEDTSELIWYRWDSIEGLGPVTAKLGKGFLLHSVLAVRWHDQPGTHRPPVEMIGIADQQYHLRQPIPKGERGDDSQARKSRPRESQLWENASEHLGSAPENVRWVRVCDRGADIYEFLRSCLGLGHGFVVRSAQDRALVGGGNLFAAARAASSLGSFDLPLRSRPGKPARTARLHVSACPVDIRSPQRPGHSQGTLPSIACTVVRVWEPEPPKGVEGLEWMLLVDEPVSTFEEAVRCARQYATRWLIEEFHKVLKTAMGAERLQLEEASRLFAAISLMSVVAVKLLELKEMGRLEPEAPAAAAGLDPVELRVLGAYLERDLKTVRDVVLAIGRLGGHMNRKADGMPGVLTLWRGMQKLQTLAEGARLALQTRTYG